MPALNTEVPAVDVSVVRVRDLDAATLASQMTTGTLLSSKAKLFVSTEQTGTGSAQNVAHGLAVTPAVVLIIATDTAPATVGVYTAVEGTHTATNVVATVTSGKKFKVLAWA